MMSCRERVPLRAASRQAGIRKLRSLSRDSPDSTAPVGALNKSYTYRLTP